MPMTPSCSTIRGDNFAILVVAVFGVFVVVCGGGGGGRQRREAARNREKRDRVSIQCMYCLCVVGYQDKTRLHENVTDTKLTVHLRLLRMQSRSPMYYNVVGSYATTCTHLRSFSRPTSWFKQGFDGVLAVAGCCCGVCVCVCVVE